MGLFHYPKSKHIRKQKPTAFKNYRTYKKYLQREFDRVCVYCRQPDSIAPSAVFGVDHYQPKRIFPALKCVYENLYYCCARCNTYKSDYWHSPDSGAPHVVNPCDHLMSKHLSFNKSSGEVDSKDAHGKHTEDLLFLNDPEVIKFRLNVLEIVAMARRNLAGGDAQLSRLERAKRDGKLSESRYGEEAEKLQARIGRWRSIFESYTGTGVLPTLRSRRLGVKLSS